MLELRLGDCTKVTLDVVPDVMIVDPPYSKHVHQSAVSQHKDGGVRERDLGFDHLSDELRAFIAVWAAKVKCWSVIYSDIEGLHDWRLYCQEAGATYIRPVPWVRWSMPQLSGDRPPSGCEFVTCFWGSQKGRKAWNGPGNLTHLSHTCLRGEDKHKCEKPLDQALDLVEWFSNPGDLVFDPCAGRATVGLACRILGRRYLGFEMNPVEHEKGSARLTNPDLSERDEDRYQRWLESRKLAAVDADRRGKLNAAARAKYLKQLPST